MTDVMGRRSDKEILMHVYKCADTGLGEGWGAKDFNAHENFLAHHRKLANRRAAKFSLFFF